jgi:hypothetical protein
VTSLQWLVLAVIALASFPTWAALHELSHVGAAAWAGPISSWSVRLWPSRIEGSWTWSSSKWTWRKVPRLSVIGWVFLAPRAFDLIACAALPFGAWMPELWQVAAWTLLCGGGLIDLGVGSVGWGSTSDLRRAATAIDFNPWVARVLGFATLAASAGAWTWLIATR